MQLSLLTTADCSDHTPKHGNDQNSPDIRTTELWCNAKIAVPPNHSNRYEWIAVLRLYVPPQQFLSAHLGSLRLFVGPLTTRLLASRNVTRGSLSNQAMESVMHYGEGIPTRCFWIISGSGKTVVRRKICIIRQTYPTQYFPAYPKVPRPDPEPLVSIEGVEPEVLRQLELLDALKSISNQLEHGIRGDIDAIIDRGLAMIQKRLPDGIELA